MPELRSLLLWLHIALAVVGLGPTYTFPIWTAMARKAGPENLPFTLQTVRFIITRMVIPMAVLLPFSGLALIYVGEWDLWSQPWLWIAIVLYTVNFGINTLVSLPNLNAILAILTSGQAGERMAEIQARGKRQRALGITAGLLVLIILGLMVWKPG
jgi:hypothetical protein